MKMKLVKLIVGMILLSTVFVVATNSNPYVLWDLYRGDKEGFCEQRLTYDTDQEFCYDVAETTVQFYPMYDQYFDILESRCIISTQHPNFCGERPVIYTIEDVWNGDQEMCEYKSNFRTSESFCEYIAENSDPQVDQAYNKCVWIIDSPRICGQ